MLARQTADSYIGETDTTHCSYLGENPMYRPRTSLGRVLPICLALTLFLAAVAHAAELVDVVRQVENSVVRVNTDVAVGSGVIVGDEGLILTNYHVIEGARRVEIVLRSGQKLTCSGYLIVDPTHDLAALRTPKLPAGSAMKIAAGLPPVGEKVAAFGNPQGFSFTTSEGIVSAVRSGQEVEQTIGSAEYQALGFAVDATWVQTTAAISHGNSGGPLVTMECELVGLNTWNHTDGQQLNFAISVVDVRRVLAKINDRTPVQGFDTLPKIRSTPIAGDWKGPREPFRLELPTGRVFGFEVFLTDASALGKLAQTTKSDRVVISHPNGAMYAAAEQQHGVLHGLTVAQWDNREPMVHVSYIDGRRHGLLKTWDEAGDPVMFGQYERGRRSGFTCLFEDTAPVLIAQYDNNRLEYLQLMSGLTPREGFASEEEALKNPAAKAYLDRLEELDAKLKKNEVQFRRQVKQIEIEKRRELAARLGPKKRALESQRAKQRAAAENAFMQRIYRLANGR